MVELPRGAADEHGRRAVVHDRDGTLIALRLTDGAVLWRHGRDLRPLAVLDRVVVALRVTGSPAPAAAVVVLDAGDGSERWTSPPLRLPDWARPELDDTSTFTLTTEAVGPDRLVLRWAARTAYSGGAPPGERWLTESARAARGTARLDLGGPVPELTDDGPTAEPPTTPEPSAPAAQASQAVRAPLAPDVLRATRIGDLRMELALGPATGTDAGTGTILLRAVDVRTGSTNWEVQLDATIPRLPPPLPP